MTAFAASWVVPVDGPPIPDGLVEVEGATVVAVRARRDTDTVDRLRGVILPGLVNAHTHVEGSAYAGKVAPGDGIAAFGRGWMAARAQTSDEQVERSARAAVDVLRAFGTALVGDVTNTGIAIPMLAEARLAAVVFHESILGAPASPLAGAALAAHTPWTSPAEWIAAAYRAAESARGLTSLHVAEHSDERRFLLDGDGPIRELYRAMGSEPRVAIPGRAAIPYLADLGALGPHALSVHCADATKSERAILLDRRSPVVLCPRSNDHIGGKLPDLPAFLAEGFRPAIGTDSLASSPSLDVLEEARALHAAFPSVPCDALLSMCTSWGAGAMRAPSFGAIRAGAAPGILFAPADPIPGDPLRWLVETCPPRRFLAEPGAIS